MKHSAALVEDVLAAAHSTAVLPRDGSGSVDSDIRPAGPRDLVRLHTSENPYGASPAALLAARDELERMYLYPDPDADELVQAIASHYGVPDSRVAVANGLDELILFLVLTLGGPDRPGVTTDSTFQSYAHSLAVTGTPLLRCQLDGYRVGAARISRRLRAGAAFGFVCNPHNPCATTLTREELHELHESALAGGGVLIVDEAYAEYAGDDFCSMLPEARSAPGICVLRTFSKAYGLAGLRVGYAIGDDEVIGRVTKAYASVPYHVNRIAQRAAIAALADQQYVKRTTHEVVATREHFVAELAALDVHCPPSRTNFVLAAIGLRSSAVASRLADRGFAVRDAAELGFPGHLRISIGTPTQMQALREELAQVLASPAWGERGSLASSLFTAYTTAAAVSAAVDIGLVDAVGSTGAIDLRRYADASGLDPLSVDAIAKVLVAYRILEPIEGEVCVVRPGVAFADVWANRGYVLWLVRGYGEMLSRAGELASEPDRARVTALRNGTAIARAGKYYGARFVDPIVESLLAQLDFRCLADIGCGSASRILQLARRHADARFVGIEIDDGAIAVARAAIIAAGLEDRVHVIQDDARRLRPWPELDEVNVVTCFFLGHEFWPRDACRETLAQIRSSIANAHHFLLGDTYLSSTEGPGHIPPIFTAGFEFTHALMGQELPTADDWLDLFEESVWQLARRTPLGIPFSEVFHLVPRVSKP